MSRWYQKQEPISVFATRASCLQNAPTFATPNWGRGPEKTADSSQLALGTHFLSRWYQKSEPISVFGTSKRESARAALLEFSQDKLAHGLESFEHSHSVTSVCLKVRHTTRIEFLTELI